MAARPYLLRVLFGAHLWKGSAVSRAEPLSRGGTGTGGRGGSAVSRAEPLSRGGTGTGGRGVRNSPLGDLFDRNHTSSSFLHRGASGGNWEFSRGGVTTQIGCRSNVLSGSLRLTGPFKITGGSRLLSSSTKQGGETIKENGSNFEKLKDGETIKENGSNFEKLKMFVRKEWGKMDSRSKLTVLDMVMKCILVGGGGGWGIMFAYTVVIARVDKAEEAMKNLTAAVEQVEAQVAESDERSEKHRADLDFKIDKLRVEVSELRSFKDLWVLFAFERERASAAVPATPDDM